MPSSPAARRLARELGVDVDTLSGTGPGGRVVEADVRAAAQTGAGPAVEPTAEPMGVSDESPTRERIPVRGMRKIIAERMMQSLRTSAQLTMDMDVLMDDAVRVRDQLNEEWHPQNIRLTYTDLVVRAAAKALRDHPQVNASFAGEHIEVFEQINIGVAVAVSNGLLVPVIRGADRLPLKDLTAESARVAAAARAGTLGLDDYAAGTFTVTALGMYGVDSFTPIIQPPQAAILGVNRLRDVVGWNGETPVRQRAMRLSLTWDHRALDGAPAAEFLGAVRDLLQAPFRLLV